MTGLRSRLAAVQGVESVELDLGEDGLQGINVRLSEGADEATVLEGIRRLLVAYGTKLPSETTVAAYPGPAKQHDDGVDEAVLGAPVAGGGPNGDVIDLDQLSANADSADHDPADDDDAGPHHARLIIEDGAVAELSILPVSDGSVAQVSLEWDGRRGRRQVPASARAVIQAVIDLGAELVGHDPISVIGTNLSTIGGSRVLTVIAGNHGVAPRVCTSSVIRHDWASALLEVLSQVLAPVPVDIREG
jgi:hypothetical protein